MISVVTLEQPVTDGYYVIEYAGEYEEENYYYQYPDN